ncbi:protein ACCELERATED CELL DEATH 6-like isoform X2 [Silene latifolia]|uniref:protein ACCELERATED CELL DEATH 6-like isoform X2 n=1 Tax=Silene latifolia TaxID=37657 RepID=UPI003D771444
MDPALRNAAFVGNVEFLKKALAREPTEYFLGLDSGRKCIFHHTAWFGRVEFMEEAMNILPPNILKQFLHIRDVNSYTVLHTAALKGRFSVIKCIRGMYESLSWDDDDEDHVKPWLALTELRNQSFHMDHCGGMTPLTLCLAQDELDEDANTPLYYEECAMEIMLMDPELVSCTIADEDGYTPLYYAVKEGYNRVAQKILMSSQPATSIVGSSDLLELVSLATNCTDHVVRLLFQKLGDWFDLIDDRGFTIVHQWAKDGEARPCKILLEGDDIAEAKTKVYKEMIIMKDDEFDTPLHIAARNEECEVAKILIRGYQQQVSLGEEISQDKVAAECPPWKIQNKNGDTPLQAALSSKHEELALEILSIDPTLCQILNNKSESPFFLAVRCGCARVVDEIMRIDEPRFKMLRRNDRTTVLHYLSTLPEKTCRMLLSKYWWIINLEDDQGKTALDYAKRENIPWLVDLLTDPSRIQKEDFDWIEACTREESDAVLAFVDHCPNLQNLCREESDTPLHHIKLPTFKDYRSFLKNSSIAEVKNYADHDGATALHRALERKDIHLARALLLDDEVQRTIKDDNGTTAMDLLAKLCEENEDWDKMCKLIKVNPNLKTSFIQQGTNLDQMRNTLSVVAALLATITFAAGFTLPGGINSDTGEAVLAKKAAFLVFLLADVYAMCTSILVLFCLIWSMVMDSEPDVARVLVDRSMFILMQSLYATLLAFMTGIYTVIQHSSLWAAIVIFVMCSVIGIAVNKSILHLVISKLIPATSREKQYRTPANQEEIEIIIAKDEERTIE